MATAEQLNFFLKEVERRAFKQAAYALRDEHLALDMVQESMLKLAEKYASRPVEEFPMLFQRILQNTIRDQFRRQKVRNLWTTLLSSLGAGQDDGEDYDPLEIMEIDPDQFHESPMKQLERSQALAIIEQEIKKLPARQREAFVLRYWEELDVAETAASMGCSEGSVKTHCSRAVHALAAVLERKGFGR